MATRSPVHHPPGWRPEAERRAEYDRGKVRHYDTQRWKRLRAAYLVQHPLCECGCGYAATVVDHRKAHRGDPLLLFAWDNLQAMTKPCHDRKTAKHDGGFGNPSRRTS
jgi:5-methylcytosine-specific restriction enzyme A